MTNAQPSWATGSDGHKNAESVVGRIYLAGAMMYLNILHQIHRALGLVWSGQALLLSIFMMQIFNGHAMAQEVPGGCGSLTNAFGPFDYRPEKYVAETTYKSHQNLLKTVEDFHFTIETKMLRRRANSPGITPGGDLDYTLRAFPNHHHALLTLISLGEKELTSQPSGSRYSIDCWFRRAVTWRPDDNLVRLIYAQYLSKSKQDTEAERQLSIADSQSADSAFTQYNIGLIFFDMKDYDKALFHAHKASALGFDKPALRDKLKSIDKWVELPEVRPSEPVNNPQ